MRSKSSTVGNLYDKETDCNMRKMIDEDMAEAEVRPTAQRHALWVRPKNAHSVA